MKRRSKKYNQQTTIILVLLAALIVAGGLFVRVIEQRQAGKAQDEVSVTNQNLDRIYEINSEIDALEASKASKNTDTEHDGMASFVFVTPDASIEEKSSAMLKDAGYSPVIAVSSSAFPGDAGMLSVSAVKSLCSSGWSLAVTAESAEDIGALSEKLTKAELPAPEAVFVPAGRDEAIEKAAADSGIKMAICHSALTSIEDSYETKLLKSSSIGLNSGDAQQYRDNATGSGNICIYEIGFVDDHNKFSEEKLQEIIGSLSGYISDGTIRQMTVSEAYDYYSGISKDIASGDSDINKQIEALQAEKEELMKQL